MICKKSHGLPLLAALVPTIGPPRLSTIIAHDLSKYLTHVQCSYNRVTLFEKAANVVHDFINIEPIKQLKVLLSDNHLISNTAYFIQQCQTF